MVSIPVYQHQVGVSKTPTGYLKANVSGDAFGVNMAQAVSNLGEGSAVYLRGLAAMDNQVKKTRALELSNKIDQWEKEKLLDPENGYYSRLGKDAMRDENGQGGAVNVLNDIESKINEEITKSGLTWGYGKQMAELVKTRKMDTLYRGATAHELKQVQSWGLNTLQEAENNAIQRGIIHRESPEIIDTAFANGKVTLLQKAQLLHWDEDTTRINLAKYNSDFYSGILHAYLQDGNLKATEFYEEHKDKLLPDAQKSYLGQVKNNELKYKARSSAENLVYFSPEEAYKFIDGIDNIDEQALTRQFYNTKVHEQDRLKKLQQDQLENNSWEKIKETLDINDIDLGGSPETIKAQMSYIEQMKKYGRIATENSTYVELLEMSTYDAERFKTLNLNNYLPYLSESEFKEFKKRQQEIGSMAYSIIQDDNEKIDKVLKDMGMLGGKVLNKNTEKTAYSEIRALVKEYEIRHGQKMNDSQLEELVKSLGYKDPATKTFTYKELEKGMAEKVGFVKAVTNDMAYFEKVHKRQPSQEERHKIIYNRANDLVQDKNKEAVNNINNNLQAIQPKYGETKELTYYADYYLPQLSSEIGAKLTIVEGGRYRKPNGKYSSYHEKGEAADISMSEHGLDTKLKIVQSQLNNPLVKAIGTSDPFILNHFKGNTKLVNEQSFDKQQGTNHVNHIHVTLNTKSNQNTAKPQTISEGTIVVNPRTGARMQLKGGKWVAINQ